MFKPTQSSVIYASPIFVICFGVRFDVLIFEKKIFSNKDLLFRRITCIFDSMLPYHPCSKYVSEY